MADNQNIQYFTLPDNYIYISHIVDYDKDAAASQGREPGFFILPSYPDSIQDSMDSTFNNTNSLGRSAPVYTYSQSGPRSMQFKFELHRDLFNDVNQGVSSVGTRYGEDYVDTLLRALQAIALPKYNLENKLVEPPWVAIRISDEIFIRGVVSGGVTVVYNKPILDNNKYAHVTISITVYETDPYDASTVYSNGGFRGVVKSLKKGMNMD